MSPNDWEAEKPESEWNLVSPGVALRMSSTMSRQSKKSYFGIIGLGSGAPEATLLHDRKDGSCGSDDQQKLRYEAVITFGALPS